MATPNAKTRMQIADECKNQTACADNFTSVARGGRYNNHPTIVFEKLRKFRGRQFAHKLKTDFCSQHRLQIVSRCQAGNSRGCKADCNFTRMTRIDQNAGLHHLRMLSLVADVHCARHTEISRHRGGLPLLRKEKTAFSGEFANQNE